MPLPPFYTIGHSDRSFAEFADLLAAAEVARVVDVRKMPGSRANPQFDEAPLRAGLSACGIGYEHAAGLGGLRRRARDVPGDVNGGWRNRSFHNYADHALSEEFHAALARLLEAGRSEVCAIMCAEAVWWRCHRRIVADYLLAAGRRVLHILGPGHVDPARLTEGAVTRPGPIVLYPV